MNPTLMGFIRKELIQTFRDPRMRVLLFGTPLLQMTLFGFAISNEVRNIRLAANFDSKDYATQKIYERAIASRWFVPANISRNKDPFELIQSGEADAVLVPPPAGLTHDIGRRDAVLQLLVDASNANQARAVENYIRAIGQRVLIEELGLHPLPTPIQFDVRVLFNPALETPIFMVPGVMCMLMIMTTMVLSMNAVTREKEMGTFEMLISAPIRPSEVIFGKTLPYILVGMANLPITLSVAVFVFSVPMRGSLLLLVLCSLVFVCAAVSIGSLISTICRNQQQANLASFLFLFPAIMFSGLIFPVENMPTVLKWAAYIDPLFHYLAILRNLMLKGGDLRFLAFHTVALTGIALVAAFSSFRRFHTTLT